MGGLNFAQDAEGNWGYIPSGADSVVPFSKGIHELKLVALSSNSQTSGAAMYNVYDDEAVEVTHSGAVVTVTIKKAGTYRLVFFGIVRGSYNQSNAYLNINDVAYASNASSHSTNYDAEHTLVVGDVITARTNTISSTSGGNSCAVLAIL